MVSDKKIIAIIPARGGSKRVPKKNIKLLAGKPLMAYTIETAKQSKFISRVIVSTEDEEIRNIAKGCCAEVIKRPAELATDTASSESVLQHVVNYLQENENYDVDLIVLLQATLPLRGVDVVNKAIEKALSTNADSVLSVCESQHYYLSGTMEGDKYHPEYTKRPRSQEMPKKFKENGAIYITKKDFLMKKNNRIGGDIRAVVMDPLASVDIDDESDFNLVENIILNTNNKCQNNKADDKKVGKIKMVLFDVDGIFTDGSVYLDKDGNETVKFSRVDGKGVELLRTKDYILGVISSEESEIVRKRMGKLKIKEIHLGIKDKLSIYEMIKSKYKLKDSEICYCGDDVQDILVLKRVGLSCCPANAQQPVKEVCKYKSNYFGGNGFVRDICNMILTGG